jgi:hypothetical protein
MDAKEFIIKSQKICRENAHCKSCPLEKSLRDGDRCNLIDIDLTSIDLMITIVENYKLEEES